MKYSSIQPTTTIKQKIQVDNKTIFMLLPDTNLDISQEIYNLNFLLHNCVGLVCPNKIITIGRRKFNGKAHFYDIKKKMLSPEFDQKIGKKIRVLNSLVIEKTNKEILSPTRKIDNYYFYDMSVWSQALEYLLEKFSERAVVLQLFDEFTSLYNQIKSNNPTYNVDLLLLIKNTQGKLFNIISNIRSWVKAIKLDEKVFFDNYTMISDCEGTTLPIFHKDSGKTKVILQNLSKLEKYIEVNSTAAEINKSQEFPTANEKTESEVEKKQPSETDRQSPPSPPSFISSLVKNLQTSKLTAHVDDKTSEVKVQLNRKDLERALKSYKITDPDIVTNVQIALNNYISTTKTKPAQEEAETLVLKAINYTVSGSDIIPEKYLHKPSLLFEKLKQIDTYKTPLTIPETNNLIEPSKLIDLKYTTGQHRQKYEFESTIHENVTKLFQSLESVGTECPVKVKKIEHTVEDDNRDRFIHYKVTLQNLTGGKKEPYTIELKVPSPVNEKYFKLHGNNYIMSNQQFLKPVTKTDKNEVRLLSNYGIIRVGLANLKFNPTDLAKITKYVQIKYPNIIKSISEESCQFSDGSTIYFTGETVYESDESKIQIDPDSGKLRDNKSNELLKQNKYEFLFETILDKIHTINPAESLTKTKKALPYIWIYLGSIRLPLVLYLWSQKGLLSTLNSFGINYSIEETNEGEENAIYLKRADGKFLKIVPEGLKQNLIVNALQSLKLKEDIRDFDDPQEIYDYITQTYGSRSIILIRLISENFVDPITKDLLQFENMPTNLVDLSSKVAVDQLLNKQIDSLSDLKIYRARLSEVILNIVYKQIKLSHNYYRKRVLEDDKDAMIFLEPDYVINNLLTTAGVLQQTEPVTPVTEIMLSSRVIKTGKGGIPNKRSFKKEHRNIHPSQYGIMGAVSTPEYVDVGLTCHHTLTPIITNKYGSYGAKDINQLSGWHVLTLDESITPFQNQVDSDRLTLARTHANQATPINNAEQPLVCTGAEFLVSQLASPRFVQRAKKDGVVVDVDPDKTITVKYKDGTLETFDIIPRLSRTKRGSYIALKMNTLEVGSKFKANQAVAFTKNFNQKGIYCSGKNLTIAIMNYLGMGHEDSYVISKDIAEETTTDVIEEVSAIIPPNTKILQLEKTKGKKVEAGDVLVEFSYDSTLDEYIDLSGMNSDNTEDELSSNLYSAGTKSIKLLAPEGEILDIKVFINNKNSADEQILSFHKELVQKQKRLIAKLASEIKDKDRQLSVTDNMNLSFINIGDHKVKGSPFNGCRIVYYIKRPKKLNIGDKISNRFGAKGVISHILETPPKGDFSGKIDIFLSPISVLGRKNIALLKELYLGKIFYHANRKLDEMADDPKITNDKIAKFIIDLYSITGPKKVSEHIKETINSYTGNKLRQAIKNDEIHLFCLVEPFEDIKFENIKSAAEFLKIPLEEKVYIPELDRWTDTAVPVGISYYMFLEHYSDVYANIRGIGKYTSLTRQPTKRKS